MSTSNLALKLFAAITPVITEALESLPSMNEDESTEGSIEDDDLEYIDPRLEQAMQAQSKAADATGLEADEMEISGWGYGPKQSLHVFPAGRKRIIHVLRDEGQFIVRDAETLEEDVCYFVTKLDIIGDSSFKSFASTGVRLPISGTTFWIETEGAILCEKREQDHGFYDLTVNSVSGHKC